MGMVKDALIQTIETVLKRGRIQNDLDNFNRLQDLAMHDPAEFMNQYGKWVPDKFKPLFMARSSR